MGFCNDFFITRVILSFVLFTAFSFTQLSAKPLAVYQIEQDQGNYLQTALSHDIYRYSASATLEDLVVMDAAGNKLPHRIRPLVRAPEANVNPIPAHYFPVAVGAPPETLFALSSSSIRLDDNEISVSVEKKAREKSHDETAPIDFYLIDLTEFSSGLAALKIDWDSQVGNEILEVHLSGSNDLTNWTALRTTVLAKLVKDGKSLVRDEILLQLTKGEYAYLKLKFSSAVQVNVKEISLIDDKPASNVQTAEQWNLVGKLAENQKAVALKKHDGHSASVSTAPVAAWEFERSDITPVSRVALDLGTVIYGDGIRIFSKASEKQPWRLVHEGIWFNVQVGKSWERSDEINIQQNNDVLWRIELVEAVRTIANPKLIFVREPEMLQFIANQNPPFSIAIETDPDVINAQANTEIFERLTGNKPLAWSNVSFTSLEPDITQFSRNKVKLNWKTFLFWAFLALAVSCLLLVAVRLIKQMSHDVSNTNSTTK